MKALNEFLNESQKPEKYWDNIFKKAINKFSYWEKSDEKADIVNSIRQAYNELELDVLKGEKGYVEMIDNKKYWDQPKEYAKFATDIWNKLKGNIWAKQNALEDYLDWLK